jgi:hypothetical protein
MITRRNPNDPRDPRNDVYRADDPDSATDPGRAGDPYRPIDPTTQSDLDGDNVRRTSRLEPGPQVDPTLAEGPASTGRIAIVAFVVAVLLGALFYGLNNSSMHRNGTPSTAQNTAPAPPRAVPSPTPGGNAGNGPSPGTTTGSAASPTTPPAANPPAGNAPASK